MKLPLQAVLHPFIKTKTKMLRKHPEFFTNTIYKYYTDFQGSNEYYAVSDEH